MKKLIYCLFGMAIFFPSLLSAQTCDWALALPGNGCLRDFANGMTIDDFGFVYVAGQVETEQGRFNPYLAKFDPDGFQLWHLIFPAGSGEAMDVEVDGSGKIYLVGQFKNFIDLDQNIGNGQPTHLLSTLNQPNPELFTQAAFLAAFQENTGAQPPTFAWSVILPTTTNTASNEEGTILCNGVDTDGIGNVYITGSFKRAIDFEIGLSNNPVQPNLTSSAGGFDIFVAKYLDGGSSVTSSYYFSIGDNAEDKGGDIICNGTLGFYLAGIFTGLPEFNPIGANPANWENPESPSIPAMFLAQYRSNGGIRWSYQFDRTPGIAFGPTCLALDANRIFMAAVVSGGTQPINGMTTQNQNNMFFDGEPSESDAFIYVAAARHNQTPLWDTTLNQTGDERVGGIAYNPIKNELALAIENSSTENMRVVSLDAVNGATTNSIQYFPIINQSGTGLFFPGMDVSFHGGDLYFTSSFFGSNVNINNNGTPQESRCRVGSLTNSLDMFLAKYQP